jgi:DNA modification methylase
MEVYKKVYSSSRQEGQKEVGNVHPTMKPIELINNKLRISSNENCNVLDLFGGSGSTLIACEQLNRKCFMMELDEHYCDVIITRWENLTGQKAVLCS